MLWDVSAEQSVIGSILLTHACLPEVARELRPGDFRLEADRAIYEAALALERDGSKVDPVTSWTGPPRWGGRSPGSTCSSSWS